MHFTDKLIQLRRKRGYSQEQLADHLGVTRQSVSKWESGAALPELNKLIVLSELFEVSVDYLVKDYLTEEPAEAAAPQADASRLEEKMDALHSYMRGYHFTSKTKLFGLPLVSIRLSRSRFIRRDGLAVGVIAIGNVAVGIVSIGAISVGALSFGAVALGGLALGALSGGLVALGATAIGVYAAGAVAIGAKLAIGAAAVGEVAIGVAASGKHALMLENGATQAEVQDFVNTHLPNLWEPLRRLLMHAVS